MDIPQIRVISTTETVEILKKHGMITNSNKIGLGLQQRVYPFGVAIRFEKRWTYEIYEHKLMEWIAERSG